MEITPSTFIIESALVKPHVEGGGVHEYPFKDIELNFQEASVSYTELAAACKQTSSSGKILRVLGSRKAGVGCVSFDFLFGSWLMYKDE